MCSSSRSLVSGKDDSTPNTKERQLARGLFCCQGTGQACCASWECVTSFCLNSSAVRRLTPEDSWPALVWDNPACFPLVLMGPSEQRIKNIL